MSPPRKPPGKPKVSGKKRKPKSRGWFQPLRWLRLGCFFFLVGTMAAVLFFRFVPPFLTPLMAIRYVNQVMGPHSANLEKSWRPLEQISPRLAEAVIASEDQLFPDHWGFDWDAIVSAFSINEHGKRKLGASTITQQTAKNLFLWPERNWTRKALEAYFTCLLELLWTKHRILEVYLNIIEMGDGVYGAEAAAHEYFGITALELNRNQAALIAACLPNPRAWSPAKPTGYLFRRQTWILRQMNLRGPLPEGLAPGIEKHISSPKPFHATSPRPLVKNPTVNNSSAEDSVEIPLPPAPVIPQDSTTPKDSEPIPEK